MATFGPDHEFLELILVLFAFESGHSLYMHAELYVSNLSGFSPLKPSPNLARFWQLFFRLGMKFCGV